jgi:ubiquinone/menaquinone biosynthesis C-methylase UbiE
MAQNTRATITGLDHVQVAIPRDGEERARAFYGGVLGLEEIAKPRALTGRGGAWFACGRQQLHLGVDPDFRPQRKGHPALLVVDLGAVRERLLAAVAPVVEDELLLGYERIYTFDPFGNRLELLRPLTHVGAATSQIIGADQAHEGDAARAADGETTEAAAIKERVREAFGRTAEAYITSAGHAHGSDLAVLLDWAAPQPTDRALDVSTGGGHTALALAPHVARVTASDLTPRMLAAARRFLTEQGVANADFVIADAERLPFLDASFELVTVRIAPHHYADARQAVREMARVLTPGGRLLVIDNIAPEEPTLDEYANRWEQRRDPSHVREYTASEWRGFLADTGLRVERISTERKAHPFAEWVERMQMPADERAALEAEMLAAPAEVREYFAIVERARRVVSWSADFLIALATKPR